jgi:hypothetical protein
MKILSEGLGILVLILVLKFLSPEIYSAVKSTLLVFFDTAQGVLHGVAKYQNTAGFIPNIPTVSQ